MIAGAVRIGYDASSPPPDPHLDVCGFYIGGDTPHVWTDAEIAGQSARWRLPIYVCDNPARRDPVSDAGDAVGWMRAHHVPAGCALALDYEMAKDATYLEQFDSVVRAAGWTVLLYGSQSTVEQNPRPSAGYWTASWTQAPHLDSGAAMTQYASDAQLGRPYDLSVVSDSLVLWDTRPPAPAPTPSGDNMPAFQTGPVDSGFYEDQSGTVFPSNTTELCVPPANGGAAGWGNAWLSLGCDFAPVQLRIAVKSDGQAGWSVSLHTIRPTDDRLSIPLPTNVGKISIGRVAQSPSDSPATPCAWLLEYRAV